MSENKTENQAEGQSEHEINKKKGKQKRAWYQTKKFKIFAAIIVALIIFRMFLPTIVKRYVNKTLANIPGYYGQVEDIDIALYRGAYVIKGLYLKKVKAKTKVPFLDFPKTDISIEWKSIFKGKIVSEVLMYNTEVIYMTKDWEATSSEEEPTKAVWTDVITDLIPIDINHFKLINGKFAYVDTEAKPDIDLQITSLDMTIDNIRNVVGTNKKLPSPLTAKGASIGNGVLSLEGDIDIIKAIPDMDLNFSLKKINLTALNDFSSHYASIDFEAGDVGIYSELAIADSYMSGYFKTLIEGSKFIGKEEPFKEKLWEGFVSFFRFILKNQKTNTLAVKVPIEGDLSNPEAGVLPTIFSIFENAFIDAFDKEIDEEVNFQDVVKASKEDKVEEERKWWQFWKKKKEKEVEKQEVENEEK